MGESSLASASEFSTAIKADYHPPPPPRPLRFSSSRATRGLISITENLELPPSRLFGNERTHPSFTPRLDEINASEVVAAARSDPSASAFAALHTPDDDAREKRREDGVRLDVAL